MFLNKQDILQLQSGYRMVSLSGKIARYKVFVNVGDMAFNGGDERIAFGPMAKGQKKYGSTTTSHSKKSEHVIVYNVQVGDTLQGIAIKFGVNTEQIRRVNHLWTNDSLFLRDKLLIPVDDHHSPNGHSHGFGGRSSEESKSEANSEFGGVDSTLCSPLGEFKMQPHWSHPLCDSLDEDCVVSPNFMKLGTKNSNSELNSTGDSTWHSSKDSLYANSNNNADNMSNASGMSNGTTTSSSSHTHSSPNTALKSKHLSLDNGDSPCLTTSTARDHSHSHSSSTVPGTPTSPSSTTSSSKCCAVVDQSEKSATEFLSRIDSAIASSRKKAKTKAENDADDKSVPWVTFDSDSETSDHRSSSGSGTSISRQGRHLRYSLRKLEKAQEELFQL